MKKYATIIILFITSISFGQKLNFDPMLIEMGWNFLSPTVLQKVNDPLTKEILSKTIPKIIRADAKGAVLEMADATFRVKKVRILNKAFLSEQEFRVDKAIKAIKTKDYATAINEIATIVTISDKYAKSGILDKEDAKSLQPDNNLRTELVKSDEINGKVIIEKNSNYYFFVPNGTVSELESKDTTITKYKLNLTNGSSFEIGIVKSPVDEEYWSIDYLEKNQSIRDTWTNLISKNILKQKFGVGIASPSTLVSTSHFRAYKLPYLASTEASMTTSLVTFHNSSIYLIYFKSSQNDFATNNKEFESLIDMFFFGEQIPFCQVKKLGSVNIINKSTNPYDLYKNGALITTLKGKSEYMLNVGIGSTNLQATQKSGFMMYPTVNNRTVNINSPCQNTTVEIGFEDK
jgi:hypothetical protein